MNCKKVETELKSSKAVIFQEVGNILGKTYTLKS